jgi:excisionase family DNA binding protein
VVPEPAFITKRHAFSLFDMRTEIERAIRAGELRIFRIGRKTLLCRKDVEEWISNHEITQVDREAQLSELQRLMHKAIKHARKVTG